MNPYQVLGCWGLLGSCLTACSAIFVSSMASYSAMGCGGALALVGFVMRVTGQRSRTHAVVVASTMFVTILGAILFRHNGLLRATIVGVTCYVNALIGASAETLFIARWATRPRNR
jgi:hypothetical protein